MRLTIQQIQSIETEMLKEISEICERNKIQYYLAYGSVLGAIRHEGPIPWDTDLDIIVPINQFEKFAKLIVKEISDKFYLEYYKLNQNSTPLFGRIGMKGYSTRTLHIDVFKLIGLPNDYESQLKIQKKTRFLQKLHYLKRVQKCDLINATIKNKLYTYGRKILIAPISTKYIENKHEFFCSKYSYDCSEKVLNASGGYGEKEIIDKKIYGKGLFVNYSGLKVRVPEKYNTYLSHFYGDYMRFPPKKERKVQEKYKIVKLDV